MTKKHNIRQLIVAISPQLSALSVGGSLVLPTLFLEHIRANQSAYSVDLNTTSWIGSIYGLAGIPVIFLPTLMQRYGRKFIYMLSCVFVVAGWAVALVATSPALLITSELFHGLSANSLMPISFLAITEMLAPSYRLISMQIFGINLTLGLNFAGILGKFVHFRTVSVVMLVPVCFGIAISCFWPESPPWLACQGQFEKSEEAFIWLRGEDDESKREFIKMLTAQKERLSHNFKNKTSFNKLRNQIVSRDFYLPALHMFLLMQMKYWSGSEFIVIYFIEMVEKTTQNKEVAFYSSIAMYLIILFGISLSATFKRFNNKTVLLLSTAGVILCLISATTVTLLQSIEVLAKDSWLCMYVLVGYVSFYSLGLTSLVFYIAAELMPVRHRSLGGALYIVFNCILYASSLKASPYLLAGVGVSGTFLVFTVNAVVCALLTHNYVPETKGRTLQEIEDYYLHGRFIDRGVHNEITPLQI